MSRLFLRPLSRGVGPTSTTKVATYFILWHWVTVDDDDINIKKRHYK